MCRAFTSSFLQKAKGSSPIRIKKEVQQEESFQETSQESALLPSIPSVHACSSSEDEVEKAPTVKGKYTDPTPTPIPRDEPAIMNQDGVEKEDSPGYSTPPEGVDMTRQQKHTALSNKLDKALEEALGEPAPRASSLKKQGGGDREPTPGPQDLHQGELNITTER